MINTDLGEWQNSKNVTAKKEHTALHRDGKET